MSVQIAPREAASRTRRADHFLKKRTGESKSFPACALEHSKAALDREGRIAMRYSVAMTAVGLAAMAPVADAAEWISTPAARTADAAKAAIALDFRRNLKLDHRPDRFVVRGSADQRFVLYVNRQRIATCPSRGDLKRWRYEEIDLAPYLSQGENEVAAKVWSDGKLAPLAQITANITAFSMGAVDPTQAPLIDTGPAWQVRVDTSRDVGSGIARVIPLVGPAFYAAGGPETIDAQRQTADWRWDSFRGTRHSG